MIRYKFDLSAENNGVTVSKAVYPVYKTDVTKDYAKEDNQEFFRETLNGKFTFQGADFAFILAQDIETEFIVTISISYDNGANWSQYWKGKFYKTDCEIDLDGNKLETKLTALDAYTKILAGLEKEYDLIDLKPEIDDITITKRPMIQLYVPGQDSIACSLSGMYWEQDCESIDDVDELVNKYKFTLVDSRVTISADTFSVPIQQFYFEGAYPTSALGDIYTAYTGDNQYKFTCRVAGVASIGYRYEWKVIRVSGNVTMWEATLDDSIYHIDQIITMNPVAGSGATVSLMAHIKGFLIYGRLVTDAESVLGNTTYAIPLEDMAGDNKNYRRVTGYPNSNVITFSGELSDEPTKWGIYERNRYYKAPYVIGGGKFFPIARNQWTRTSVWYIPNLQDEVIENAGRVEYTMWDAYPLHSVINVLLSKIDSSISHKGTTEYSQFLYGTNPITHTDYKLFITQKSNILAGNYDEAAQKAPITMKNVLDMLRDCFRCYWFIDNGKLRIEHISWFMNGGSYGGTHAVGVDLTELRLLRNGKAWSYAQNKFSYDKPDMPERYQFGWMDDVTEPFIGEPLNIKSRYIQEGNIEEINVDQFTSDVDYMLLNPEDCSKDGFALLAPVEQQDGTYKLPIARVGGIEELQNCFMSFKYLQEYYLYDLPAKYYEIGESGTLEARGIKRMKQQEVSFPAYQDLDPNKMIKTELGDGVVEKISINLSSRNANVTLRYDTE